jgi:hypothetical protein
MTQAAAVGHNATPTADRNIVHLAMRWLARPQSNPTMHAARHRSCPNGGRSIFGFCCRTQSRSGLLMHSSKEHQRSLSHDAGDPPSMCDCLLYTPPRQHAVSTLVDSTPVELVIQPQPQPQNVARPPPHSIRSNASNASPTTDCP